jgi:hypothetical protein
MDHAARYPQKPSLRIKNFPKLREAFVCHRIGTFQNAFPAENNHSAVW